MEIRAKPDRAELLKLCRLCDASNNNVLLALKPMSPLADLMV
jgi:hypothetical protein